MPESCLSVADYFVRKASEASQDLRPLKLLKLVYLAHGWHLGFTEEDLIREEVQAWPYGPVIPDLYHEIKEFRDRPIPADMLSAPPLQNRENLLPFLDMVWSSYGKLSGGQLSTITHEPGSPWHKVWVEQGGCNRRNTPIPSDIIRKFYKEKADHVQQATNPTV